MDDEDQNEDGVTGEEINTESMNYLRQLVKQRPDLTIYFQSANLDNVEKVDEYDPLQHLAFQINNYDSLSDDIFYDNTIADYNELMRLVNGTLPDDFYKKYFSNQHSISIIIRECGKLKSLRRVFQTFGKFEGSLAEKCIFDSGFLRSFARNGSTFLLGERCKANHQLRFPVQNEQFGNVTTDN